MVDNAQGNRDTATEYAREALEWLENGGPHGYDISEALYALGKAADYARRCALKAETENDD